MINQINGSGEKVNVVETLVEGQVTFVVFSQVNIFDQLKSLVERCKFICEIDKYSKIIVVDTVLDLMIDVKLDNQQIIKYDGRFDNIKPESIELNRINALSHFV